MHFVGKNEILLVGNFETDAALLIYSAVDAKLIKRHQLKATRISSADLIHASDGKVHWEGHLICFYSTLKFKIRYLFLFFKNWGPFSSGKTSVERHEQLQVHDHRFRAELGHGQKVRDQADALVWTSDGSDTERWALVRLSIFRLFIKTYDYFCVSK